MRSRLIGRVMSIGSTDLSIVIWAYHTDHVFGVGDRTAMQHIDDGAMILGNLTPCSIIGRQIPDLISRKEAFGLSGC